MKKLSSLAKVNICGSLFITVGVITVILRNYFELDVSKYSVRILWLLWIPAFFYSIKHMFFEKHDVDGKK